MSTYNERRSQRKYPAEQECSGYGKRVHYPIFEESQLSLTTSTTTACDTAIYSAEKETTAAHFVQYRRTPPPTEHRPTYDDDRGGRRRRRRTTTGKQQQQYPHVPHYKKRRYDYVVPVPESNITTYHPQSDDDVIQPEVSARREIGARESDRERDSRSISTRDQVSKSHDMELGETYTLDPSLCNRVAPRDESNDAIEAIRQYVKEYDQHKNDKGHEGQGEDDAGAAVKKLGLKMSKSDEQIMQNIFKKCAKTERDKVTAANKNNNAKCYQKLGQRSRGGGTCTLPPVSKSILNACIGGTGLAAPPKGYDKNSLPLSVFTAYAKQKPRVVVRKPQLRERLTDFKAEVSYLNPCRAELRRQCQCIIEQKRYLLMKNSDSDTVDSDMEGLTRCQLATAASDMRIGFLFRFGCKRIKKTAEDLRKDYETMQTFQKKYEQDQLMLEMKHRLLYSGTTAAHREHKGAGCSPLKGAGRSALKVSDDSDTGGDLCSKLDISHSVTGSRSDSSGCAECDALANQNSTLNNNQLGLSMNNPVLAMDGVGGGGCCSDGAGVGDISALNSMMFPKMSKKKNNVKDYRCKLTHPRCDSSDDDCMLNDDEIINKYGADRKCMDPRYKIVRKNPPRCKFNNCCEYSYFANCDELSNAKPDGPGSKKVKAGCPTNTGRSSSHKKCKKSPPGANTPETGRKKTYSLGPRPNSNQGALRIVQKRRKT